VLGADERRIVQLHAAWTISWPGIPRDGERPPSQAFTVAPTSAN
jgi:hypothetical protein